MIYPSFLGIPADVRYIVLNMLDPRSLARLGGVCRRTREIVENAQELWENIATAQFNSTPPGIKNWKQFYTKRALIQRNSNAHNFPPQSIPYYITVRHIHGDLYFRSTQNGSWRRESFGNEDQSMHLTVCHPTKFETSFSGPFGAYLENPFLWVFNCSKLILKREDTVFMALDGNLFLYQDTNFIIHIYDLSDVARVFVHRSEQQMTRYLGAIGTWMFCTDDKFLRGFNYQKYKTFNLKLTPGADSCTFSKGAITEPFDRRYGLHNLIHLDGEGNILKESTNATQTIIDAGRKISLMPGNQRIVVEYLGSKEVSEVRTPERFEKMETVGDRLIVTTNQATCIYDLCNLRWIGQFAITKYKVIDDILYLSFPMRVTLLDLYSLQLLSSVVKENYATSEVYDGKIYLQGFGGGDYIVDLFNPLPGPLYNRVVNRVWAIARFLWGS